MKSNLCPLVWNVPEFRRLHSSPIELYFTSGPVLSSWRSWWILWTNFASLNSSLMVSGKEKKTLDGIYQFQWGAGKKGISRDVDLYILFYTLRTLDCGMTAMGLSRFSKMAFWWSSYQANKSIMTIACRSLRFSISRSWVGVTNFSFGNKELSGPWFQVDNPISHVIYFCLPWSYKFLANAFSIWNEAAPGNGPDSIPHLLIALSLGFLGINVDF